MAVVVVGTGMAVPEKKVKNEDLPASLETSDEWIYSHTGIRSRHIAGEGDKLFELAAESAKRALSAAGINAGQLDLIIVTSVTQTYDRFPTESCLVQAELGAENAMCFDMLAGCTGFVYGLDTAAALLEWRGWKYGLVCGAEFLSRISDWTDRSTCVLFGDGAGSAIIENTVATGTDAGERGIKAMIHHADGKGGEFLYRETGGFIRMDGQAVYNFAVREVSSIIKQLMAENSLTIDDVDMIVCHQANSRIISAAAKRLSFPLSKFVFNIEEFGNTSSSTIPIALTLLEERGELKKGMRIILVGFGAGLTSSGGIVVW